MAEGVKSLLEEYLFSRNEDVPLFPSAMFKPHLKICKCKCHLKTVFNVLLLAALPADLHRSAEMCRGCKSSNSAVYPAVDQLVPYKEFIFPVRFCKNLRNYLKLQKNKPITKEHLNCQAKTEKARTKAAIIQVHCVHCHAVSNCMTTTDCFSFVVFLHCTGWTCCGMNHGYLIQKLWNLEGDGGGFQDRKGLYCGLGN